MSKLTTLQIGGPAKKFVVVKTEQELIEAIKYANKNNLKFLVIGGGSNLLVSNKGVNKLIIKNEISVPVLHIGNGTVTAKSGMLLQDLVDYTINKGLSGLQKLTGIPGTLGGAVYGNAGAYGQTISDNIHSVVVLNERSSSSLSDLGVEDESKDDHPSQVTLSKKECDFDYRDSIFKKNHSIILEVTFKLEGADPNILKKEADDILSKRLVKYPKGIKCPGSFFKNIVAETLPKEILDKIPKQAILFGKLPAGYLLESVGAKGQKLDGIEIAPYHANLFINKDRGAAQAFYTLAKKYKDLVKDKFGITLEPEVQLINLPPI